MFVSWVTRISKTLRSNRPKTSMEVLGVATRVSFISQTTTKNIYGICNIYVTFKQRRISASAKTVFVSLILHICVTVLSLVHTVPDFSPGVATVWTPGLTGTTPYRRRQAPHWIGIHRVEPAFKPRSHCPGVRPAASRQFTAGGPGRTGTNRDGIRVRSYIPGSAADQARCRSGGATVCPGVSRYTTVLPQESAAEPRCHCGGSRK